MGREVLSAPRPMRVKPPQFHDGRPYCPKGHQLIVDKDRYGKFYSCLNCGYVWDLDAEER